jgi:hypothetical protein
MFLDRCKELGVVAKSVEICFIVPKEISYEKFTPDIAEGTLGEYSQLLKLFHLKNSLSRDYSLFAFERRKY